MPNQGGCHDHLFFTRRFTRGRIGRSSWHLEDSRPTAQPPQSWYESSAPRVAPESRLLGGWRSLPLTREPPRASARGGGVAPRSIAVPASREAARAYLA